MNCEWNFNQPSLTPRADSSSSSRIISYLRGVFQLITKESVTPITSARCKPLSAGTGDRLFHLLAYGES